MDCFRLRLRNDGCGISTSPRHCELRSNEAIQELRITKATGKNAPELPGIVSRH